MPHKVLQTLRSIEQPLYALLDAARSPLILPLLKASGEHFESLYGGDVALDLEDFAPYLVHLKPSSALLEQLVAQGWGDAWGIYVTSRLPFEELRRHFKKFLMVRGPQGQEWFFRYYDPRVMRSFLPTCGPVQLTTMFGPVENYWAEGEAGINMMEYRWDGVRLSERSVLHGGGLL